MLHVRALLAICLVAPSLFAQANWTQLTPLNSPGPRAGTWGCSDGAGVLLFGGLAGPGAWLNETWRFDGFDWTNLNPATAPSPRDFYAAAFDQARGRLVLFGGRDATTEYGDTWEFDGTNWTQMFPAVSPSPRRWAAMAYDSLRNETILFGGNTAGSSNTGYVNETWRWDGTNWTRLFPANSPSARGRGFLSYDPSRGEMLYYGGRNSAALADTWIYDGTDWRQVQTTTAPGSGGIGGLFAYGMTYDLLRDRHVVYGGTRTGGTLAGTWEFDGSDWSQTAAAGPASRTGCTLCYVLAFSRSFLFGGFQSTQLGDTWDYQTQAMPIVQSFGAGCVGASGQVTLAASNLPWLGDSYTVTASNLAAAGLTFHLLGFSDNSWSGGALPLPLQFLYPAGGLGCDLLVSPDSPGIMTPGNASAFYSLALPNDPSFAGYVLYQQALQAEFDAAQNITTLTSSNGLAITLGAR